MSPDHDSVREAIAGALARAGISAAPFEVTDVPTLAHSQVARVRLHDGRRLIFKRSGPGGLAFLAVREARFYRAIAPTLPPALAPRCFLAEEDGGSASLLLDDLGASHATCARSCPTLEEATAFVEALAELHAAGAGRPSLADEWARGVGSSAYDTILGRLERLDTFVPQFVDAMRDSIDARTRDLLAQIEGARMALVKLARDETILHGDAHYWNGLYSSNGAVLLDWGNACLGPGEIDLAHAVALNLPPEVGRVWEAPLLDAYRRRLQERGVSRSGDELRARYGLGVLYAVTVPMGQWRAGIPERVWRPLFANVIGAALPL